MPPNRGSRYECLSPAVSLASCVVLKSASDIEQVLVANTESTFENVVMEINYGVGCQSAQCALTLYFQ
jgi:hypothetical protein